MHTSDDKITAVINFPRSRSIHTARSFLGIAGYCRPFIHNFAAKATPLTRLFRKESTFHWSSTQETDVQELKYPLTHTPVLTFPDYKDPFIMCTDASTVGLGAVIMKCDERRKIQVTAYASYTLNSAEASYSITHLETLAVVWGLKRFRDIILGYEITVYTDHAAIIKLFKNITGKLVPWYFTIQEFSPKFKYIQELSNMVADALPRNALVGAVSDTPCNHLFSSGSGYCTKKA